ncbi:MFS transporter [Kitasatospora sp. NPDC002551]|uniref:MFS transporter n=1 Tax=Kitasatospora sp. NPDC002551 TaxID=3154539 RepID=UPI00331E3EE3
MDRVPADRAAGAAALWSRDFRLFFTARTVAMLGDAMLPVALSVGILDAGYGPSGVGYALGAWTAALALCMLFGGALADRLTPRRLMVWADGVRLVVQSVVALGFLLGTPSLWQIVAAQVVSGVATAMFQPGVASMVPAVAPDVQRANGSLRVAEALAALCGPALAGAMVAGLSPGSVFAVYAATYGISGWCLLRLRVKLVPQAAGDGSLLRQLADGWREFRARTWLWAVIALFTVYGFTVAGVSLALGGVLIIEEHGATAYGTAMAAFGGGCALGGVLAMKVRPRRPLLAGAAALTVFTLYPLAPALGLPPWALATGWGVAGVGCAFWGVVWATTVQTQVPTGLLNRMYAYDVTGSLAAMALGRTFAGPLADRFGGQQVLVGATVLALACCAALPAVPAIRGLRAVAPGGDAPHSDPSADRAADAAGDRATDRAAEGTHR